MHPNVTTSHQLSCSFHTGLPALTLPYCTLPGVSLLAQKSIMSSLCSNPPVASHPRRMPTGVLRAASSSPPLLTHLFLQGPFLNMLFEIARIPSRLTLTCSPRFIFLHSTYYHVTNQRLYLFCLLLMSTLFLKYKLHESRHFICWS